MLENAPKTAFFDAIILGAGAAGLFCAAQAGQRGLRVLLVDHSAKVAEKIRISGGGRCNFTNREVGPAHFLSDNPHFCRSALSRYTPQDFLQLLAKHRIAFHEKHKGQLFCDDSAENIIAMLLAECAAGGVQRWQPCQVHEISTKSAASPVNTCTSSYQIHSSMGVAVAPQLVIATGGLSIPKIGATDFGYRIAQQFGLRLVMPRPALVPLIFAAAVATESSPGSATDQPLLPMTALAGLSLPVEIQIQAALEKTDKTEQTTKGTAEGKKAQNNRNIKTRPVTFTEDLLFTHRGLSGPAVLQISSYWRPGQSLSINLAPGLDIAAQLLDAKATSRKQVATVLAALVPARLAEAWTARVASKTPQTFASAHETGLIRPPPPISDVPDKVLLALAAQLSSWKVAPSGSEGYQKAEVTAGGVDTRDLSSQTLQANAQPGLYFIGEVVDVTGWLGGYNFQWAWASAFVCAEAMALKQAQQQHSGLDSGSSMKMVLVDQPLL